MQTILQSSLILQSDSKEYHGETRLTNYGAFCPYPGFPMDPRTAHTLRGGLPGI